MPHKFVTLLRQLPQALPLLAVIAFTIALVAAIVQSDAYDKLSNAAAKQASDRFVQAHPDNARVVASLEAYLADQARNKTRPRPPSWEPTRCERQILSRYDYELDLARSAIKRRWPDSLVKPEWPVPTMPVMSADCLAESTPRAVAAR